ncbi:hypothetical protein QAD02_001388 [Eretmocerus hayati]|uniref:Uncharacterized protein n=1 Tax=Eretmocerus hayati TaxID=131215 RepID=A0ACC2NIH5_9HYME|nr:hypothetical protein QAD02_001388 [Eretmocerus hayati]
MTLLVWMLSAVVVPGFVNAQNVDPLYIELNDGNLMPRVGFGTFNIEPRQVDKAIESALQNGYRHFDLAPKYGNEEAVGKAFKRLFAEGYDREQLFIATKLEPQVLRASDVSLAVEKTLRTLGIGYIDMYLIHVPFGFQRTPDLDWVRSENGSFALDYSTDLVAVWRAMENLVLAGRIRSIGLSNFNETQISRIWNNSRIKPSNIQMEVNAYIQQQRFVEWCQEQGMVVTAYSPLGSRDTNRFRKKRHALALSHTLPHMLDHPVVISMAHRYSRSPAQILLRYSYQRNIVVIPKSVNPKWIAENINIFDFYLRKSDMGQLRALDQHGRYKKFDFSTLTGARNHPEFPFVTRLAE